MLKTGTLIDGKYKILSEIGHGGMSCVYMAINEKANKTWAVKEVQKNGKMNFEMVRQGLVTEINILKELRHPNLPSIVDVIEDEESFLIVMDYIEGNTLSKMLKEYNAIPQEYVILWAKVLCSVLLYLHTRVPPIIYRDIKPENIMLKPDGNLMLIDFGTAREFKVENQGDTVCLGTVGYAAPEQFGGLGQTDARTDIYGLGATMYHLLTGQNPGKPPYEMKPIRQINPNFSEGLEQIIQTCTHKNPKERYQSAAELMYALEHYEEIDSIYKKKQVKKLICFGVLFICVFIFGSIGGVCDFFAVRESNYLYNLLLDEASKAVNYEDKLRWYCDSMAVPEKEGELPAYLGMIQTYKEDDMVFTYEEAKQLTSCIRKYKEMLQKNMDNYVRICFEVGKLYWYYFVEKDGSVNQAVRGKYAVEWFEDVLTYASEEYKDIGMAQVYSRIGRFYRDIEMDIIEGNDKGEYALLYEDIKNLLTDIAFDEQESEMVRLELLYFSQNAMLQYTVKFQQDGVKKADLEQTIQMISLAVDKIRTTTEKTEEKKRSILALSEDTKHVIQSTYETCKE